MTDKIYVQKVSVKKGKFGLRFSGKAEDVIAQIKQHTNSKGYFNWNINERKEVGKYGETHSVTVDTWEPANQGGTGNDQRDDLPF